MSFESYIRAAPKAELHVHLEGSIQPETLLELARRSGVELPAASVEGLRQWFNFRDFDHFIEVYVAITRCLRTAPDYELIVYELGREMARQGVRYAEVTFSPSTHYALGVPHDVYFSGLQKGRERARIELGVEINWVFDIVRNIFSKRPDLVDYTTGVAIDGKDEGVLALGLGGMEQGHPPEPFAPYFERALAAGLRSDPHAGELGGPDSIWGAIRALHADRIGHGVRAVEDPALVAYLAERQLPLEVNPTSNLRLGVYPSYQEHPLRRLYEAGVPVTVNTDDPPMFNTTLDDELQLLPTEFGFDLRAIDEVLLGGIRHSFIEPERRDRIVTEWGKELDRLKREHLP